MYAVTGASGNLGRLVVESLLARGVPAAEIAAVVRTPDTVADLAGRGVVVRAGDYDEPASWPAALAGIDTLLLVSSNVMGQRVRQHTAVIDAAQRAGVSRVAYTSILKADTSTSTLAPEHLATEQALAASGLGYALLRNAWYYENYLGQAGQYVAAGEVVSATGSATFSAATRADYAAAAATVLLQDGATDATYELGGEKITMAAVAAAVATAAGSNVAYRAVTPDELRRYLTDAGLPAGTVDMVVDIDRIIAGGELDTDSDDLARLVGRPLTTLTEAAATLGSSST